MDTAVHEMGDDSTLAPVSKPNLEDFYGRYCPVRFPQARSRRAKQRIAKTYRLPVIKIGHAALIDPIAGDDRLRQLARFQEPARRHRGRPRT